jgi:hypothetical protein
VAGCSTMLHEIVHPAMASLERSPSLARTGQETEEKQAQQVAQAVGEPWRWLRCVHAIWCSPRSHTTLQPVHTTVDSYDHAFTVPAGSSGSGTDSGPEGGSARADQATGAPQQRLTQC